MVVKKVLDMQCTNTVRFNYLGLVESKEYLHRKKYYVLLAVVCQLTLERYNAGAIALHRSTSKISHSCVRKPFVIRLAQPKTHIQHLTHVQHPVYAPFGNVVMHLNVELCWRSLTLST